MAVDVGHIVWTADIETARLTQAEKKAGRSLDNIDKGFDKTERSAGKLGMRLKSLAASVAGVFAVRQLNQFITGTAQAIDTQNKFAGSIGASYTELQKLQFAAQQNGASTQELNNSLRRLVRRTQDAAKGTGEAVKAFDEMNLDAKELARLAPEDLFKRVADAMSGIENEGNKVSIAFRLFDTEGAKLIQTLNGGSEGINALGDEAERTGRIVSDETAVSAAAFNDEMNKLKGAAGGLAATLAGEVLPSVTSVIESMTEMLADGETMDRVLKTLSVAGTAVSVVFASRMVAAILSSSSALLTARSSAVAYKGALSLLGGPAGAIAAVTLGLGYYVKRTMDSDRATLDLDERVQDLTKSYKEFNNEQRRVEMVRIKDQMDDLNKEIEIASANLKENTKQSKDNYRQIIGMQGAIMTLPAAWQGANEKAKQSEGVLKDLKTELSALETAYNELSEGVKREESGDGGVSGIGDSAADAVRPLENVLQQLRDAQDLMSRGFEPTDDPFGTLKPEKPEDPQDPGNIGLTRIQALEQQYDREKEILEQSVLNEEDIQARKTELARQYSEQRKALMEDEANTFGAAMERAGLTMQGMGAMGADAITDVVSGLKSGEDAAKDLGKAILGKLIGAMVQMGISAITQQAAVTAGSVASGTASAAAWAPAAAAASTATMGAAPAAGASSMAAMIPSMISMFSAGGGRLYGGNVNPGSAYPVNEDGRPEMLVSGGKQYLLPGARGEVISNRNMTSNANSGNITVNMTVNASGGADEQAIRNVLFDSEEQLYDIISSAKANRGEDF